MNQETQHRRRQDAGGNHGKPKIDPEINAYVSRHFDPLVDRFGNDAELKSAVLDEFIKLAHTAAKSKRMAEKEPLTGLLNRRAFFERYTNILNHREPGQGKSFMMGIDVDFLKRINRISGDRGGDAVLTGVAQAFKTILREHVDLAGRIGGDEFLIMINDVKDRDMARAIVTRLGDAISKIAIPGYDRPPSVSIGCVEIPAGKVPSPREIMQLSELARTISKTNGRNAFTLVSPRQEHARLSGPAISFVTRKFGRDNQGAPTYDHIIASGDVETARASHDQCRYDVIGSLDRVYSEIEAAYSGNLGDVLTHYQVQRMTQLNAEQLEEILFDVRNRNGTNQNVSKL